MIRLGGQGSCVIKGYDFVRLGRTSGMDGRNRDKEHSIGLSSEELAHPQLDWQSFAVVTLGRCSSCTNVAGCY